MSIDAGRLDREITFHAPSTTLNDAGESVTRHDPLWTVFAEIKQTASAEGTLNGAAVNRVTYQITTHYLDDVATGWEIELDSGRRLAVSSVTERGRKEELAITAHEVRP